MNNRWVKLLAGVGLVFLAVTLVGSLVGRGMMRRAMMRDNFRQAGQFERGRNAEQAAPDQAEGQTAEAEEFEGRRQEGRSNGRDRDHGQFHGRSRGHHGGRAFGFFGGLIRLAGLALLALAGVVYWRGRNDGSSDTEDPGTDNSDDPPSPDMTEAEIRAAMKRLGIDKIEL